MAQNNLSDAELAAYQTNKAGWFKGTIAVCVVYGVFALALLAIAVFDTRGRQFLSEDFLPFTITFVAGMIVVIILLVVQIVTFKPKKLETVLYDREVCPDYWKFVPTTSADVTHLQNDDSSEQHLMKMKCVPDPEVISYDYTWNNNSFEPINLTTLPSDNTKNVFGHTVKNDQERSDTYDASKNKYVVAKNSANQDSVEEKLFTVASTMYGDLKVNNTSAMRCDVLYPALLAKADEMYDPEAPNQLRCKYAQLCGINWSSICS